MVDDDSFRDRFEELRDERDAERQRWRARQQAILAKPDGVKVSKLLTALETLEKDDAKAWLAEHPDARERLEEHFARAVEHLQEIFETIPDEAWKAYEQRLEFTPEEGIYENATLHTPDGEYPAGQVYFWSTTLAGEHLVDILERNVPPGVDLQECRLEIRNDDGVMILAGDVLDDPPKTLGDGYCLKIGDRDD